MQLAQDLATGDATAGDLPPIRVFEQDGDLYSLDNRRLFAGQMANVNLPYVFATRAELGAELNWEFSTDNNGIGIIARGIDYFFWFGR
jgi:hypothetical protein